MAFSKPVIAAVEGYAVAGGLELALMCDMRVAARSAVFGVFCRRWGVPLIDGGTVRLPRIVGRGTALDIILTGRKVPAEECLRIGLCERLVPDGEGRLYCPVPLMQRYIEAERSLEVGLADDLEDLRRRGLAEVPKPA